MLSHLGAVLAHLGSMLGPRSPILGLCCPILAPFWTMLCFLTFDFHFCFSICSFSNLVFSVYFHLAFSNMFDVFCFVRFFTLQTPPAMQVMHPHPPSITRITWWAFFLGTHLGVMLGPFEPCWFFTLFLPKKLPSSRSPPWPARRKVHFFTHFSPLKMPVPGRIQLFGSKMMPVLFLFFFNGRFPKISKNCFAGSAAVGGPPLSGQEALSRPEALGR